MVNLETITGKVSFAIGTGRCGTQFLAKVIENERAFSSIHERNPLNDTFHRYCKWYNIPVDHEGFLAQKEREINEDLKKTKFSFESSAFLSLSSVELYKKFDAKFIMMVRSPEKVINSYLQKGWYENKLVFKDPSLPPTYQLNKEFHHFLGRIAPIGDELVTWNEMSRVSKLIWYWKSLNERILEHFEQIAPESYLIKRLEDMDFASYKNLINFLGDESTISEKKFNKIAESKPNTFKKNIPIPKWTNDDIAYFRETLYTFAAKMGYNIDSIDLEKFK